jgi:hypothetical protein
MFCLLCAGVAPWQNNKKCAIYVIALARLGNGFVRADSASLSLIREWSLGKVLQFLAIMG